MLGHFHVALFYMRIEVAGPWVKISLKIAVRLALKIGEIYPQFSNHLILRMILIQLNVYNFWCKCYFTYNIYHYDLCYAM